MTLPALEWVRAAAQSDDVPHLLAAGSRAARPHPRGRAAGTDRSRHAAGGLPAPHALTRSSLGVGTNTGDVE